LQIDDVGEVLHGNVEDPRENAQLVEGGIGFALLDPRELGIVDRLADRAGALLDPSEAVPIALAETPEVVPQPFAAANLLHRELPPPARHRARNTSQSFLPGDPLSNYLLQAAILSTLFLSHSLSRPAGPPRFENL